MSKRVLTLLFVVLVTIATSAQFTEPADPVPAYNAGPPRKGTKLPPMLREDQLLGESFQYPFQAHAYRLASRIPVVLHQQPCYCYCDRMGHNSLHSCFESTHAANCAACLKELYYSYAKHKAGKTAAQIRRGIIAGKWKQINLQATESIN